MKGKQLFVIYSYYQLLIALVESAKNPKGENNFIIWNQIKMFSGFIDNINKLPFINSVVVLPHELNDFAKKGHSIKKYINYFKYNLEWYSKFIDFQQLDNLCDKSEINVFLLSNPLVLFVLKKYPDNNFRFIEEGETTYAQNKLTLVSWVKRNIYRLPFDDKKNPSVKEIWVKFPERLNPELQSKVSYYNSQEQFLSLKSKDIDYIIDAFNARNIYKLKVSGRSIIILTQPLSEDKLLTEQQKIEAYKKIIHDYGKGYNIAIKVHPRDKTNYEAIFPGCLIISKLFPAELFNVFNISFTRGVTIFSSSIYNIENIEEKIFLGIEWNEILNANFNSRYK